MRKLIGKIKCLFGFHDNFIIVIKNNKGEKLLSTVCNRCCKHTIKDITKRGKYNGSKTTKQADLD